MGSYMGSMLSGTTKSAAKGTAAGGGAFDFTDGGRTYRCHVEAPRRGRAESWWWFGVSGDETRYAPFRAAADDTEASVREGVVAYYADRLARRGVPWQDRGDAPAVPALTPPAPALPA